MTRSILRRFTSSLQSSKKGDGKSNVENLNRLQGILSKMKVNKESSYFNTIKKFGHSDLFNYATNKQYNLKELKSDRSNVWDRLTQDQIKNSHIRLPLNGFDEMILLTEQGRLWKYPVDNEQGLDAEKSVPFEEHVFLDHFLREFPKNEYIQSFMGFVIAGLGKSHWINVERKHDIINFYKDYFEKNRETFKATGLEL